MNKNTTITLVKEYINNEALFKHCRMVATAMEGYAKKLGLSESEIAEWWTAGMIHDIDWEKFPDEHPNYAVTNILPKNGYSHNIIEAVKAHAPGRTGKNPTTLIEKYLFACDELSGFINAVALIRPSGLSDMEASSVNKRLKDKRFAANVSREDIEEGLRLINLSLNEHTTNMINFFKEARY